MLDPWIIEQIKREEEERREQDRPRLELPNELPDDYDHERNDVPRDKGIINHDTPNDSESDSDRGVTEIKIFGKDTL